MSRAAVIRLAGFLVPACVAVAVLFATGSWFWFVLCLVATLLIGIPVERLYRHRASHQEQTADIEDRVRNPPA